MADVKKLIENLEKLSGKKVLLEELYKSEAQKEIKCPNCQSEEADPLGPSDYKKDELGNYKRLMGYKCKKCGQVYNVDKEVVEEGFAVQTPNPKQGQDPMF